MREYEIAYDDNYFKFEYKIKIDKDTGIKLIQQSVGYLYSLEEVNEFVAEGNYYKDEKKYDIIYFGNMLKIFYFEDKYLFEYLIFVHAKLEEEEFYKELEKANFQESNVIEYVAQFFRKDELL